MRARLQLRVGCGFRRRHVTCCDLTTNALGLLVFTDIFFAKTARLWFNSSNFLK